MDVQISSYPPLRVASVEHRGAYDNIGEAFGRLGAIARPSGLLADPAAAMVALYYDDPQTTPVAELRSEAGLVVSEHTRLPAGLTERRIAGGRYARTVHRGPYTNLGDAWARLMSEWLPSSGQRWPRPRRYLSPRAAAKFGRSHELGPGSSVGRAAD